MHAVVVIASDRHDDLRRAVTHQVARLARHRVTLLFEQEGATRVDEPGHEHFRFKDGISQPGLKGVHVPNPDRPDQGDPGQDLLDPGEFIFTGDTPAAPPAIPPDRPGYGQQQSQPTVPQAGPLWAKNGSYLVFRRLRQDVPKFREQLAAAVAQTQPSEDLTGAKLVGRYRSGAPLETNPNASTDPGIDDPSRLEDDVSNDFDYQAADADGHIVPRAAHIRKTYPRDQQPPGEEEGERRRLMRRGIPFGRSFRKGARADGPRGPNPEFPHDRGLLFICHVRSIEQQFEFVQQFWVDNPNFPVATDGVDPVLADGDTTVPGTPSGHVSMQRFVKMTGGEYFFAPSIDGLALLSAVAQSSGQNV